MNIEEIDWKKIILIPEKKKGYRFAYNMSRLKISTPEMYIPFGIEMYNNKEILNFTIYNKDNVTHNFIRYLETIEKVYEQFSGPEIGKSNLPFVNLPPDFIKDVQKKEFTKTLKPGTNGSMLRTHVKNVEISDKNNKLLLSKDIIKKKCKCEIELANVWIYGNKYGLVWHVNKIQILE
ncbi:hypothetical protein Catovirus_1_1086 [Catovirus CTV1]|uniref:Uncharacterized protein n=1 Tax=Catovirus CTV1 TaxID=1977631 RepID=A0A1V0SBG6_9VIRU|nr:hypothetical protein Catovirus_1_1086 [Catovirus CTV1]